MLTGLHSFLSFSRTMSDDPPGDGLEGLLSECGVSPPLTSSLIMAGWTIETFAACSDSLAGFDAIWTELYLTIQM